ncbi:DnaJ domain protein [Gammaproteobacteria bacterium MOLA455]|nr:DnaJ domain protein [Gammaproteobacteria bacterium MOLA455]
MIRLLLLVAIIFSIWYWWTTVSRLPQEKRRAFLWRSAFWLVLGASVMLVATGRMHWLGAGLAVLVPVLKGTFAVGLRALPFLQILSRFKTSPSQFRTKSLAVEVNFSTRQMDGEVLAGEFAGRRLSDLSASEAQTLSDSLRKTDRESFVLMQAYMMRSGRGGDEQSQYDSSANSFSDLSDDEALKILGLESGASKEDIGKAHKRLMQRLHPDRGGSDYLAAKINAAKDQLLSRV